MQNHAERNWTLQSTFLCELHLLSRLSTKRTSRVTCCLEISKRFPLHVAVTQNLKEYSRGSAPEMLTQAGVDTVRC